MLILLDNSPIIKKRIDWRLRTAAQSLYSSLSVVRHRIERICVIMWMKTNCELRCNKTLFMIFQIALRDRTQHSNQGFEFHCSPDFYCDAHCCCLPMKIWWKRDRTVWYFSMDRSPKHHLATLMWMNDRKGEEVGKWGSRKRRRIQREKEWRWMSKGGRKKESRWWGVC